MRKHTENFLTDSAIVSKVLNDYMERSKIKAAPVIHQTPCEQIIDKLDLGRLITEGNLSGESLEKFLSDYLEDSTRLHHPGYLAHQVSTSHPTGALGAFIDATTNNPMAIYEMGPSAAAIEYFMINWMLKKVGWKTVPSEQQLDPNSDHGAGVLTHGGSLANLTALLAARSAMVPDFWTEGNPGNLVILVPEQSHYSMKRSVAILGFGEKNCITLPADKDGRVLPAEIPALIERLKESGKRVITIVANACGTAAGLYDPLPEISQVCRDYKIWFHVDAAHGGGALVSRKYKYLVEGIAQADSIIWDAHKMLRTPNVCAAVLVREHHHLDQAFSQEASYLFHKKDQPGFDFMPRTVECTKAGLGLRLFMTIAAMGENGLEDHVDYIVDMAKAAANYITAQDGFEIAIMPETNILCFRTADDDDQQLEIRRRLLEQGNFFISTTLYRNRRWLRLVFMNPVVTIEDVKDLITEIRQIIVKIQD
ncbi:MAG: aminotransferase class I/II-fold pyridoxal phosphate-dependent enzyme [Emcibacter sp.]|nr:aminotransferase class I/II-fold pyridoxal phosphate-dependent enzyme [Emcibacter sp.]